MLDVILSFIPGGGVTAALGGLVALIGAALTIYLKGRGDANSKAENRVLKGKAASQEEQLEMHREADVFEREAAALSDEQAAKEALEWSKRR